VHELTGDDFARLIRELRDEGKAQWTIRNVLTTASSMFRWAAGRRKLMAANPVRALEKGERPKVRKRPGRTLQRP
jgi:site-specific recombinase XerD